MGGGVDKVQEPGSPVVQQNVAYDKDNQWDSPHFSFHVMAMRTFLH